MSFVTPNVPPVETTPKAAIVASQTPLDIVNAVINDPLIAAVFNKYFGTSAHGPAAAVIGGGVTVIAAHFGLSLTPDETLWLTGVVALLAGYGWNLFAAKVLTPATPVTRGTT
jgi:hypothetical protein